MSHREHLSPVDAAWYRMDERGDPADIGSVMIFDGPLDEARVRGIVAERLARHPRFRQRVVDTEHRLTSPWWEDEPGFSADAHLDTYDVAPVPGLAEDDVLAELFSQWMSEPLDWSRSPWRTRILRLADGRWGLFCRLHHCMGDGFALMHILVGIADAEPDAAEAPKSSRRPGSHHEEDWIHRAGTIARDVAADAAAAGHLLAVPFEHPTPLRGELSGRRCVAWSPAIPLDDVKRIAHASGATVNDVLTAAISGALRRWLGDHGVVSAIRAMVPVNLRPADVPVDETHGNWFGLVYLDLPTDVDGQAARIAAVHREMDRIKKSREAVVALAVLAGIGRAPAAVDHFVDDLFSRKASVVVTNVPGPRKPLHLAGCTLRDMWFWAPHPCGLGLGASIGSYAGKVRVGIRTDRAVVPDPERIARWFVEELAIAAPQAIARAR